MKPKTNKTYTDWLGEVYNSLESLFGLTRSDAQGVADGQPFTVAQCWGREDTPENTARYVMKSATV